MSLDLLPFIFHRALVVHYGHCLFIGKGGQGVGFRVLGSSFGTW